MALSIRDILILDYFDGKPVHHKIPPYKLKIYGQDANDRIGLLYENGWIRYSRPQETVSMLPDKALSDFLKRYGLSGEGSHAELTGRVISQIPESDYAHGVPKIYVLTKEGKAEIGHHMAYVLNVRENYGLTEGEIGESQNTHARRRLRALFRRRPHGRRRLRPLLHQDPPRISPRRPPRTAAGGDRRRRARRKRSPVRPARQAPHPLHRRARRIQGRSIPDRSGDTGKRN